MQDKPQLVLISYDPQKLEIEVEEVQPGKKPVRGVAKGRTVDEFKKFVRSKYGDSVDIINKIQKNRDIQFKGREQREDRGEDERYRSRDIRQVMRNDDRWDD